MRSEKEIIEIVAASVGLTMGDLRASAEAARRQNWFNSPMCPKSRAGLEEMTRKIIHEWNLPRNAAVRLALEGVERETYAEREYAEDVGTAVLRGLAGAFPTAAIRVSQARHRARETRLPVAARWSLKVLLNEPRIEGGNS